MGMITALTIVLALIVDFLMLPALLLKFDTHDYSTEGASANKDNTINNNPITGKVALEEG